MTDKLSTNSPSTDKALIEKAFELKCKKCGCFCQEIGDSKCKHYNICKNNFTSGATWQREQSDIQTTSSRNSELDDCIFDENHYLQVRVKELEAENEKLKEKLQRRNIRFFMTEKMELQSKLDKTVGIITH